MEQYITAKKVAVILRVSERLVRGTVPRERIVNAKQHGRGRMIPVDAVRPENSYEPETESPPRLKRILYQLVRNNHYSIYEFLQIDLAYSSCRMTNNRLTRY